MGGGAGFHGQHTLGRRGGAQPDHLRTTQGDGERQCDGSVFLDWALDVGR